MDIQQTIYDVVQPMLDFWLLISLLTTLVVVQFFKAAVKHYAKGKWQPFTITASILFFAVIAGYTLTRLFLEMPSVEERRLAMAIALLNVAIYEGTLAYARRKGWVNFEAMLRMKRVQKNEEGDEFVSDQTMIFHKDTIK